MPSINQLIKKVLPPGSRVAAGESALFNEVSWVIGVRPSPPGFDSLKGNEFAVIGQGVPAGLGVSLTYLINTLAERGVCGIGIVGEIGAEVINSVQNKKLAIIELPAQSNTGLLESAAAQLINEERQFLYQKERDFNHSLMEIALSGGGTLAIIQKLRELTGRNLGFIDLNYNPHFPLDAPLAEAFKKQVHQAITRLRSESARVTTPVIGLKLIESLACFLGLIRVGREITGYLMLLAPEEKISEVDRLAVRSGSLAMAVEMSRRQAVEETEARFESNYIEDLLSGDFSDSNVEEIAKRLNLDFSSAILCLVMRLPDTPAEPDLAQKNIERALPESICHFRNGEFILLWPAKTSKSSAELRQIGKTVAEKMSTITKSPASIGLGRTFTGARGIQTSFREAEQALNMGNQLFGSGAVTCFTDLGIYRLLFSLKSGGELSAFYQENLGELVEYDRKHDGELIYTLKVFLRYNSISDTARVIHVHRNTLLYRLTRIQEITGANLEDGDTRLTLHLSILAGEILNLA